MESKTETTTRISGRTRWVVALCVLIAFAQTACYNKHFISKTQLEKLEATVEQKNAVSIIVDGCDVPKETETSLLSIQGLRVAEAEATTDAGAAASATPEGIDPETGCPIVKVSTASPIHVLDKDGQKHRVTPFNFAVTESQLVSPDYDLLLPIDQVEGAEIQTFSGTKTGLLIGGTVLGAVGLFVALALTAGEERQLGNAE